jgi:RNA polymerase sigma-70 factor (ECF subfamily)
MPWEGRPVTDHDPDADELLDRAQRGDSAARNALLVRYRLRLRQMVSFRLDRRLLARLDPSDVVQEVLAEAARRLPGYLSQRPLPFYPWLRALAWERLVKLHRDHIHAQKRSVCREEPRPDGLPDESAQELANRLVDVAGSPSAQVLRTEQRRRVQEALARLPSRDRELLVLRYLEQLSTREIAAVLGASEGAVKTRHVRALERLHTLLAYFSEGPR